MSTSIPITDPNGKALPLLLVNNGQVYWYIRQTFGDIPVPQTMREARKLGRTIKKLVEAGDYKAVRALVEAINRAPPL